MKKTILGFSILLIFVSCAREETIDDLAHRVFELAATQVRIMDGLLEENECPRSLNPDGSLMKSTTLMSTQEMNL